MNKPLFSALTLEKIAVSLAVGLIVMVAALNIVATLILLVMEKHRDIAILKTMGASARSVTAIFMVQGLLIGVVGTSVGAALGYGLSFIFDRYQLIRVPIDVYQVSYLPFTVLRARLRARRRRRGCHLLPRDDLSLAAGRAARPRAGAPVRMMSLRASYS